MSDLYIDEFGQLRDKDKDKLIWNTKEIPLQDVLEAILQWVFDVTWTNRLTKYDD